MSNAASAFRGKIVEKYGTVQKFAEAMHWSGRKASYVSTGRQVLTIAEAEKCAEVLDIENVQEFLRVFFPVLSNKWTGKRGA